MRDTFIDCGAFTGDIVQKVVENSMGVFCKIYAFEPNRRTYAAMKRRAAFLKDIWALGEGQIVCERKGVGDAQSFAIMQENPSNQANTYISSQSGGQGDIEIVALDEYRHILDKRLKQLQALYTGQLPRILYRQTAQLREPEEIRQLLAFQGWMTLHVLQNNAGHSVASRGYGFG